MTLIESAPWLCLGLFLGILAFLEAGLRIGRRRLDRDPEGSRAGLSALEGSIFGLFGLLLAFTFSGAAGRIDTRRDLITQEANDIGTAYLRLDLLPEAAQPRLRELFRTYLDTRLEAYAALPDIAAAYEVLGRANRIQGDIWAAAVAASRPTPDAAPVMPQGAPSLVLSSLNAMFDTATSRTIAARTHPPTIIFAMLFALALISALLVGHAMAAARSGNWLHRAAYAAIIASTIYVIIDLEHPRMGLFRVTDFDQALIDVRNSMK